MSPELTSGSWHSNVWSSVGRYCGCLRLEVSIIIQGISVLPESRIQHAHTKKSASASACEYRSVYLHFVLMIIVFWNHFNLVCLWNIITVQIQKSNFPCSFWNECCFTLDNVWPVNPFCHHPTRQPHWRSAPPPHKAQFNPWHLCDEMDILWHLQPTLFRRCLLQLVTALTNLAGSGIPWICHTHLSVDGYWLYVAPEQCWQRRAGKTDALTAWEVKKLSPVWLWDIQKF